MTEEVTEPTLEQQLNAQMLVVQQLRDEQNERKSRAEVIKNSVAEIRNSVAAKIYDLEQAIIDLKRARDEQIEEVSANKKVLDTEIWDANVALRKAEALLDSLQRQIDQARRAELKAAEFKTLEDRWDLLTMGAPWREWAKDHQISGGKKCTYEGRMILADTMGLGKTLTSLITIDMIEAATKDASPDNPIKFGAD